MLCATKQLRAAGIKVELYPENVKVAKQFQYADRRNIPLLLSLAKTDSFQISTS
jgi:histidyl-tRNA synthetase